MWRYSEVTLHCTLESSLRKAASRATLDALWSDCEEDSYVNFKVTLDLLCSASGEDSRVNAGFTSRANSAVTLQETLG